MFDAIALTDTLMKLDVSKNNICDRAVASISETLLDNFKLTHLNLSHNKYVCSFIHFSIKLSNLEAYLTAPWGYPLLTLCSAHRVDFPRWCLIQTSSASAVKNAPDTFLCADAHALQICLLELLYIHWKSA